MNEFQNLYGPTAVVTGASSGIGKSFAMLLARRGLNLVLVARRKDRLEALAAELRQHHNISVTVYESDLAKPSAAADIIAATANMDIGLVVSNAGFGLKGEFSNTNAQQMADMLMVNCHTPMQLAHGFLPALRARGKGGIVFTSSVEGLIGCPYSTGYAATKALIISLGEGLWGELQEAGIDVLTLCPGATDTEAPALQGIDPRTLQNLMAPDDVAELALANLKNGPTYIPSEHYKASFDMLLSLPRRHALQLMAKSLKPEA